ncbi:hypothetical protein [Paenibacillus sanguinis]|uniref:hypothetical protein n=1 Tax=Paenibacillus sanguinis TaxID=225906 RepID=UPI00036027BF|nr:hypothetical protein [Paenibacillus sanguinis]
MLESALVMPVFVLILFWFIYMIHMALLTNQLNIVASNAVKQVSAHIYPVAIAISNSGGGQGKQQASGADSSFVWEMPSLSLEDWAEQYADALPSPLGQWVIEAARRGEGPLQEVKGSVLEEVLDPLVKPLLEPFVKGTLLQQEHLHVRGVTVPNLKTGKQPYFGLEISYDMPIRVPFTGHQVVLQARAEERLWIGDTDELNTAGDNGDEQTGQAPVVISKPDPAYAGRKATIQARIAPGASAKLTVYYKSGVSRAKYLGEAQADEDGDVDWNWLVGGNTTPGTWTFVIETDDGLRQSMSFEVVSRAEKKGDRDG